MSERLGFLGLGKMGQAIARKLKNQDFQIQAYDPALKEADLELAGSARELEKNCGVLLLCVKPGQAKEALAGLSGEKKYISIMAGLSTEKIASFLGRQDAKIARVMPNISALSGNSVNAIYASSDNMRDLAARILGPTGAIFQVEQENDMHAITGLSGSGPAFVALFCQALAEGGVLAGLSYHKALELARLTIGGTVEHLIATQEHPDVLRNQVTSAGGTTIAGLEILEEYGVRAAAMQAVVASARRSRELEASN